VFTRLGPFDINWYGLMYLFGFILAAFICFLELRRKGGRAIPEKMLPEMVVYALVGMIIGGRFGYIVIYNPSHYIDYPIDIFANWRYGQSFHGGLLGIIFAGILLARKRGVSFFELADVVVVAAPIGIMLVKIGNFINGELYGRVTTVPWGVVFPKSATGLRHPSQLYEAFFEGPVLFIILWLFRRKTQKPGDLLALFLLAYGALRFGVEFFREPDVQIGFLFGWLTMGQILCACMMVAGGLLLAGGPVIRKRTQEKVIT
jgi:phosphatidylglycerol---prolipoprotein diacylglyceryl transferase